MTINRTLALIRKEFLHILRDPRTLAVMFVMPIVQLVLLGYAATTDIEHLRTAVFDGDRSAAGRELIKAYGASNYFDIALYVGSEQQLEYLVDSLKGVGLEILYQEVIALMIFGVAIVLLAATRFSKRLD